MKKISLILFTLFIMIFIPFINVYAKERISLYDFESINKFVCKTKVVESVSNLDASFYIRKTVAITTSINPKTKDNIFPYVVMFIISSILLISVIIYASRKRLALIKVDNYK